MGKRRKRNLNTANAISRMEKNVENIAKNTTEANRNTAELAKNSRSKLNSILTIIGLIATIAFGIIAILPEKPPEYELYLNSEYTKLCVNTKTDIIATLNFNASSISITAYLNSVKNGDTLEMIQENDTKWHKKVTFMEPGIYDVIATAIASNGDIVEKSIEIEVTPTEWDIFNQFFEYLD